MAYFCRDSGEKIHDDIYERVTRGINSKTQATTEDYRNYLIFICHDIFGQKLAQPLRTGKRAS